MFVLGYFDPGSASLLMQALVGGGAGLAVFGRYLWTSLTTRHHTAAGHPVVTARVNAARPTEPTLVEALSGEFRFNIT